MSHTSFSSFYPKKFPNSFNEPYIDVLSVLNKSVNSLPVVHRCMKLVAKLTNHLNPDQTSVMTADKPVFTIAKQLQWQYPERFDQMFIMLGPLHIKMAFMSAIGDWITGNGSNRLE